MHRWYQFQVETLKNFEEDGLLIPGRGYYYESGEQQMVEMHIDDTPDNKLLTLINSECPMGGNLIVRKNPNEKLLLSFGHDECIFRHQFIFTGSEWQGTKGEQCTVPNAT